jgi:hypothetical protein
MNPVSQIIGNHMMTYQKNNNVTRECIMNSLLFIHLMKENNCETLKPHSVIVLGKKDGEPQIVSGHIVVRNEVDKSITECSYEIASLTDRQYFDNIKKFMETGKELFSEKGLTKIITLFLKFNKTATGLISVMDKTSGIPVPPESLDYFTKQHNFIKRQMKQKVSKFTRISCD